MTEKFLMWKELIEVPDLIRYNIQHFKDNVDIDFKKLNVDKISQIRLIASGSSNNASQAGRFIFEEILNIPTTVEYASEFAHKNSYLLDRNTLVIGISQSGKTADTLAALRKIKSDIGCPILGITNVKPSPIYSISDCRILIGAGKEKAIPATKSFSLQLLALFNLSMLLAESLNMNANRVSLLKEELNNLPGILSTIINNNQKFKHLAEKVAQKEHLVILSRGENLAVAKEGALKFKETCYIDANGYASGEFLHGYFAMLDNRFSVVVLEYLQDELLQANIHTLKQKSTPSVYAITMNPEKSHLYDDYVEIPQTKTKLTSTFAFATSLQMLAFFGACYLNIDPDRPRNLSKYLKKEK